MVFKIKKTIIVIEDDELLLDSYKYFINSSEDFILRGTYSNVQDALEEYKDIYPDIIISDISMPGINGIEGLKRFKKIDDTVKIIMISIHDDICHVMDSVESKADGYLTKPISQESLINALKAIDKGGAPLSFDVSRKLIGLFQNNDDKLFSEREKEVINLFTKGYTYKYIAKQLFITQSTVSFHIQNIYNKLDVNNKSEALQKLLSKKY